MSPRTRLALAALGLLTFAVGCRPAGTTDTITNIFGSIAPEAIAIAHCESGYNPRATSPTNDYGLFQINTVHQAEFTRVTGQPWSQVFDVYWNTVYAKHLYDASGWRPWACSTRVGL